MTTLELAEQGVQEFSATLRTDMGQVHPYVAAAIDSYLAMLGGGGKRVRGQLVICGYRLFGGADDAMIARAAGAVEAIHAYLLVVDDVADHAQLRRGQPAAHVRMADFLRSHGASPDAAADMAISGALTAQHQAQAIIASLPGNREHARRAAEVLNNHLVRTSHGQVLDMASTTGLTLSEAEIVDIAQSKTAFYSFLMPLEVGAILAGARADDMAPLATYAQHAGLAFQLQDDIMGVFGNEAQMGKSAQSDIREGKQTLLILYAREAATENQRSILTHSLGNADLHPADFAACQKIIKSTGALERVRALAQQESDAARKAVEAMPAAWPAAQKQFLRDLAAFSINRKN